MLAMAGSVRSAVSWASLHPSTRFARGSRRHLAPQWTTDRGPYPPCMGELLKSCRGEDGQASARELGDGYGLECSVFSARFRGGRRRYVPAEAVWSSVAPAIGGQIGGSMLRDVAEGRPAIGGLSGGDSGSHRGGARRRSRDPQGSFSLWRSIPEVGNVPPPRCGSWRASRRASRCQLGDRSVVRGAAFGRAREQLGTTEREPIR